MIDYDYATITARVYSNGWSDGYAKQPRQTRYDKDLQSYYDAGFNDGKIDRECESED